MIPFFVGYAVMMWLLAFRGRRRLAGWSAVLVGAGGLLGVGYLHMRFSVWAGQADAMAVLQLIYYPYALVVTVIAAIFALAPSYSQEPGACEVCGYDLLNLHGHASLCPECGAAFKPLPSMGPSVAEYQRRKWGGQQPGMQTRYADPAGLPHSVKPIVVPDPSTGLHAHNLAGGAVNGAGQQLPEDHSVDPADQQHEYRQARDKAPA